MQLLGFTGNGGSTESVQGAAENKFLRIDFRQGFDLPGSTSEKRWIEFPVWSAGFIFAAVNIARNRRAGHP
jgi:hypothetical protein